MPFTNADEYSPLRLQLTSFFEILSEKNLISITFYEKPVRAWITVLKHSVKYNPIKNDLTRNYFKNAWRSSMRFHLDLSKYLNVKKWVVFGGSWGSTLSLSYAILHPKKCKALILRGIFLIRKFEINWFYQEGCNMIYPDQWENYKRIIPKKEQKDFVKAYYKRLTSKSKSTRIKAATAWSKWEASTSKLVLSLIHI